MARTFNYSAFVRQYRQRCAQLGVDPVEGATSYVVAQIRAEQHKAAHVEDLWWRDYALWTDSPPHRSDVEEEALARVFRLAFAHVAQLVAGQARQREILRQQWRRQDSTTSLRQLLAGRGEKLVWLETYDGNTTSVVMPLDS